MFQQIIALLFIAFFVARLFWQRKKEQIGSGEFHFWLIFWFTAALAMVFLKQIDYLVAKVGFSGQGIEILFYLGTVLLFYLVFKLRLRQEKIERQITKIVRAASLKDKL